MSEQGIYVSQVNGFDIKACGKVTAPCRTISYGIQKLSTGLYIYLDGTGTFKNPYTCQILYPAVLPFVYFNQNISFVSIKSRAYISCRSSYSWIADGSKFKGGIRISFSGLTFRNTIVHLYDVAFSAHDTVFEKTRGLSLDIQLHNVPHSEISLNNVSFRQNARCIKIKIAHRDSKVIINITNTVFFQNGNRFSMSPSIFYLYSLTNAFVGNIQLRNCSIKENTFREYGMLTVDNRNGNTNVLLKNLTLEKNKQIKLIPKFFSGLFNLISGQTLLTLEYGFFYNTSATFLRVTLGQSAEINISNIDMDGFNTTSYGRGGLVNLDTVGSCYLSIKDSFFRNGNTSGSGGILFLAAKYLVLTIQNSIIHHVFSSYSGGAVYIESKSSNQLQSANWNKNFFVSLSIINSSFSSSSSGGGGALGVFAQKLFAIIKDSSFRQCSATEYGGALYFFTLNNATIILHNNYFLENRAQSIISAANFRKEALFDLSITNGVFVKNNLCSQNKEIGVVTVLANCTKIIVKLKNTHFIDNLAGKGSSIFISVSQPLPVTRAHPVTLDACVFRRNVGYLGTIYVNGQAILKCYNTIFDSNGGVPCGETSMFKLFLKNSIVDVTNTTFVDNFCNAIYVSSTTPSLLFIYDSAFVRNRNIDGKGGIVIIGFYNKQSMDYFDVRISGVLFQENIGSSSSVLTVASGKVLLKNCTFLNNFVHFLGGVVFSHEDASVTLAILHTIFRQTFHKIVINNTKEFVATSFVRLFSARKLFITNTTLDQQTKSNDPLIFVPAGNDIIMDNSSLSYCPLGQAIEESDYQYIMKNRSDSLIGLTFSCKACDYNFYSLQRGTARGFTVVEGFQCLPCPRGANCVPVIKSKNNYWGYHASSNPPKLAFTICPFGYCKSPQFNGTEYNACQGKRSGVMCGICSQGYTEALWSTYCTSVEDCNDHWYWVLFLALVFSMAIILVFKPPFVSYCTRQILWFKNSSHTAKAQDEHELTSSLSVGEETVQANISLSVIEERKQDKRQFSRFVEIIFYFYQIAQLLRSSSSLKEFFDTQFLEPVLGFFNFQPSFTKQGFLCPFPGLTPETKLVFKIGPVLGTLIAIFLIYSLHSLICRMKGTVRPVIAPYLQASIKTIFLGYATLATVSISLIRCVFVAGENRWFYNGNIICYQWWQYASYAFITVFVIPFTLVLVLVSFKLYHDKITARQFIMGIIFPLPFLLLSLFHIACPSVVASAEENQNVNALKEMLLAPYRQPDDSSKRGVVYWQSVLIARRFVLVLIFCIVTEPSIRLFCMTIACAFVFGCHLQVNPFQNSMANNLESLSLFCLIILGLVNLFKSVFVGYEQNVKGSLITVLKVFQWLEAVMLGLFPAVLFLLLTFAVISFLVRVLFVCCRLMFNFFIRSCVQRWLSRDSTPLLNVSECTDDDMERYFVN